MGEKKNIMEPMFKISSSKQGKQCDFFPFGSLHENREKIHYFCEVEEIPADSETKECQMCHKLYLKYHPFVVPDQMGDHEMCSNCFERKYITNSKNYRECIRQEVLLELRNTKNDQTNKTQYLNPGYYF